METLISSLSPQHVFPIVHGSDIAAARRVGQKLAAALDFDDVQAGRLAIVITEAGTNILKHAGEGTLYIMRTQSGAKMAGVDVLAVDNGPGIADLAFSIQDGISTVGTAGTGLGALQRQSDEFDVWSERGKGAVFFMRLWRASPPPEPCGLELGALHLPLAGEDVNGDAWAMCCDHDGTTLLGADGLGHGPEAHKASSGVVEALARRQDAGPSDVLQAAHEALRGTRGAAVSVARVDYASNQLRFVGIGNVSGIVIDGDSRRTLVSHNGIVGSNMRKVQEFTADFPVGALCILHSDGIQTQWDLGAYPGLAIRATAIIAAVLMRDCIRRRDDAMVLVARRKGSA